MKKLLLSATLVALANSAVAADLPASTYKAAPVVAPAFSWTGCYIGIEGGGNWGRSRHINAVPTNTGIPAGQPITDSFELSGALAGGTAGCNYQSGNWVFGIENDLSWTDKSGTGPDIAPFNTAATSETRERWIDTLRGRLGFAWDRALLYGTGGAAFAGTSVNVCNLTCVEDSQTRTGWVAGVGIEYAVWQNISLKLEYLHADFGSGRYIDPSVTIGTRTIVTRDVHLTDDIVRAGLNWRFGWEPVVAKY